MAHGIRTKMYKYNILNRALCVRCKDFVELRYLPYLHQDVFVNVSELDVNTPCVCLTTKQKTCMLSELRHLTSDRIRIKRRVHANFDTKNVAAGQYSILSICVVVFCAIAVIVNLALQEE